MTRHYIIRTEGPQRFGPWAVKRESDGEVVSYAASREEAREIASRVNAAAMELSDLPPLVVHVAEPVDDRLRPRPWRPA